MKKLKYGIILLFSIIMFSIPVLAAQTYYLPSKIVGDGYYMSYSYDKYGHIKKIYYPLKVVSGLKESGNINMIRMEKELVEKYIG